MSNAKNTVLFLHGFLSSTQGTKARFLAAQFQEQSTITFHALEFNPTPRDFEYMTITGQINRLRQLVWDQHLENISLIGSSLGGQVAVHYAHRYGGVNRLLLLAPALFYTGDRYSADLLHQWQDSGVRLLRHPAFQQDVPLRYDFHLDRLRYDQPPPPPVPTRIIHGLHDDVVSIAGSRRYARQYPELVRLIEVDSDHRLNDQLNLIGEQVQSFLLEERV